MRQHRAAAFARRDAGEIITIQDLLHADARDDAEDPQSGRQRLDALAARLTQQSGMPHHVYDDRGSLAVWAETYEEFMPHLRRAS